MICFLILLKNKKYDTEFTKEYWKLLILYIVLLQLLLVT